MSTLKANTINNISASAGGITIDSSGTVSGSLPSPNRNLLYNGAFQINQRGTSTTGITTSGYYTADRWSAAYAGTFGTWTQDIQNDAPTGSGFRRSLRMLCTTADAAPAAGDLGVLIQRLEGQDLQRIAKGTPFAQRLTISFWVKSNVTGTYIVELYDADNNRSISSSYTISTSATWEKKSITFAADTTGPLDNDNASSLEISFCLGAGSTFSGGSLQTTWGSLVSANRYAGQTNLAAATNNYWQITGVQLETGDPTEFEFKSFGQELRECQRYYNIVERFIVRGSTITTTNWVCEGTFYYPTMRIAPVIIRYEADDGTLNRVACVNHLGGVESRAFTITSSSIHPSSTLLRFYQASGVNYSGFQINNIHLNAEL